MAVALNCDDWAEARVGIFFPANNETNIDGNLTGQCVTEVKWFMAEMGDVPNPFAARGDARYVGHTLVNQGLADEVPVGQQKRGDIVTYEYGTYGHIGNVLSGNRIFQENVNTAGAQRRVLADGTVVYSSTIVPLYGSMGGVAPRFYRLRSYKEQGSDAMIIQNGDNWYARCNKTHVEIRGRELPRETFNTFVGVDFLHFVEACSDDPEADQVQNWQVVGQLAVTDNWQQQIYDLQEQIKQLGDRPTAEALAAVQAQATALQAQVETANEAAKKAQEEAAALELEHINSQKTGNAFVQWMGEQLNKILGKG